MYLYGHARGIACMVPVVAAMLSVFTGVAIGELFTTDRRYWSNAYIGIDIPM